ncbi:MAG: putative sensor domain DACNV-containing protein [Desulfuromonadales bacterium]
MNKMYSREDDSINRIHEQLLEVWKLRNQYVKDVSASSVIDLGQFANLVDTAFWSSLKSNEGRTTRVFICVVPASRFSEAMAFDVPLPYDDVEVSKLAPAVSEGGCLALEWAGDKYMIWGIGKKRPPQWHDIISVELSGPGTIRICVGPFQPLAVLDGRSNPVFQGTRSNLAAYLHQAFGKMLHPSNNQEMQTVWRECLALTELARLIVDGGHGGMLLIVPGDTGNWGDSLSSFLYRLHTPDLTMRNATRRETTVSLGQQDVLKRLGIKGVHDILKGVMAASLGQQQVDIATDLKAIAALSSVDGAIVLTQDLRVIGFGAKIAAESSVPAQVCMFRPEPGTQPVLPTPLEHLGGTRHQSAARFAAANKDAVVIVISQDRHMSVVHWHEPIQSVAVVRNAEWWV